ncbi:hypothetical protein GQX74_014376 [Glossina fuscipes]|nr:hypothetical protein GQX74_014376 [Glossina fuscipes]
MEYRRDISLKVKVHMQSGCRKASDDQVQKTLKRLWENKNLLILYIRCKAAELSFGGCSMLSGLLSAHVPISGFALIAYPTLHH